MLDKMKRFYETFDTILKVSKQFITNCHRILVFASKVKLDKLLILIILLRQRKLLKNKRKTTTLYDSSIIPVSVG